MQDPEFPEPFEPVAVEPVRRGHPVIAWVVILLVVAVIVVLHLLPVAERPLEAVEEQADRVEFMLMRMQGKFILGAAELGGRTDPNIYEQAKALNEGSLPQRLRFVVLAGELASPEEALLRLRALGDKVRDGTAKPSEEEQETLKLLERLYEDYDDKRLGAPSLAPGEREKIRERLDWFGQLALAPAGGPDKEARDAVVNSAVRTVIIVILFGIAGLLLFLLGFVGLIVFLYFFLSRKLHQGIQTGIVHGGIYAETFAVWLVLFLGLSLGAGLVAREGPQGNHLLLAGAAMLLSTAALAWPVLRGVPWTHVRQDIGLTGGPLPALEPFTGIAGYIMTLPILAVGVVMTIVLLLLQGALAGAGEAGGEFAPTRAPAHPVFYSLTGQDLWAKLQVFILASIVAPLVEETMFRGVFHRHLREATGRLGFVLSFLISAFVVSFIFAVVHPQGFVAVPALMSLAFGFSLLREWRGSLIPGMVAHGVSNGLVLSMFLLFSSV